MSSSARVAALVPAAGRGERLAAAVPKALVTLGGEPMLARTVRTLACSRVDLVVVAAPPALLVEVTDLLSGAHEGADLVVVAGGDTRSGSVRCMLAVLPDSVKVVLVHDAARPLVPVTVIDAVIDAVEAGADAVVPALPMADTIKEVTSGGSVVRTLDRRTLRTVQTPQGFRRQVLVAACSAAGGTAEATDDAGHVEANGGRVTVVAGAEESFKITTPLDLVLAEAVLARRATPGRMT